MAGDGALPRGSGARADTPGLHDLARFMLGAAALFVVVTLADRSLEALRA